ncbi:MAG: Gfo/Idh/MocA family oxidoreductase [Planctomycetota bacterium]|nr:Gfo/Idh/MocA family oxidoreductase [Planctomycetota bacterium]
MAKRLSYGMVGGGQGAFIGAVHRVAAELDRRATLVAGALGIDPEVAYQSGIELGLDPARSYRTWPEMLKGELARPANDRIDFVSIVTPNHVHYEIAMAFIEAGFHVVCEKPMVTTVEQGEALVRAVQKHKVVFGVTYNYTGYPMVKRAAELVKSGKLGQIRKVFVEYHQGWLATKLEATGQAQASWRVDPTKAGLGGAIGDIGSHAENLVSTITGLEIESVCADLTAFVPGRALDDDAAVLLRLGGGAKGVLTASQVCVGEENNLSIRVYGTEGAIAWRQENPNELHFTPRSGSRAIITRGGPEAGEGATRATRIPPGHPEGFYEAFANIYRGVCDAIVASREGRTPTGLGAEFPDVVAGLRGVRFITRVVESARQGGVWTRI